MANVGFSVKIETKRWKLIVISEKWSTLIANVETVGNPEAKGGNWLEFQGNWKDKDGMVEKKILKNVKKRWLIEILVNLKQVDDMIGISWKPETGEWQMVKIPKKMEMVIVLNKWSK